MDEAIMEVAKALGHVLALVIVVAGTWLTKSLSGRIQASTEQKSLEVLRVAARLAVTAVEEWAHGRTRALQPAPSPEAKLARAKSLLSQYTGVDDDVLIDTAVNSALAEHRAEKVKATPQ